MHGTVSVTVRTCQLVTAALAAMWVAGLALVIASTLDGSMTVWHAGAAVVFTAWPLSLVYAVKRRGGAVTAAFEAGFQAGLAQHYPAERVRPLRDMQDTR